MALLVIDTNSLIQCLSSSSPHHELWESLFDGRNTLCVSNEILEEYAEVMERSIPSKIAASILNSMMDNAGLMYITPTYHFSLVIADPDDNKFVDCAIAAHAKFIVTEDSHFNILRDIPYPKVDIIRLDDITDYSFN